MEHIPPDKVTDFDFYIEYRLPSQAIQWTVADDEPVHRGHIVCETGIPGSATKADNAQIRQFSAWSKGRTTLGLPPWVGRDDVANHEQGYGAGAAGSRPPETNPLRSSWTLRQWADNYCQSRSRFKEFVYEKVRLSSKHGLSTKFDPTDVWIRQVVHGWNLKVLSTGIEDAIRSTGYEGYVTVNFEVRSNKVVVRPDSRLSRVLLPNPWLKIPLSITFVYPCVWLYKRICGGRWRVAGGAYALNRWSDPSNDFHPGARLNGRDGVCLDEKEWVRTWEATICRSVIDHRIEDTPMCDPSHSPVGAP
jgi:hypothetical protein